MQPSTTISSEGPVLTAECFLSERVDCAVGGFRPCLWQTPQSFTANLITALERNGHLTLEEEIRHKILSLSTATIDRLLQMPRRTSRAKKPRLVPEPQRRIKMRTLADWNEPLPSSMEIDLVAHGGNVNRGSYVHNLALTDIASGWTGAAPIVVREAKLVVRDTRAYPHGFAYLGVFRTAGALVAAGCKFHGKSARPRRNWRDRRKTSAPLAMQNCRRP
jgi:hypothetical protein